MNDCNESGHVLAVKRKMETPQVWSHPALRKGPSMVEWTNSSVFLNRSRYRSHHPSSFSATAAAASDSTTDDDAALWTHDEASSVPGAAAAAAAAAAVDACTRASQCCDSSWMESTT
jgi:hypothetical protein